MSADAMIRHTGPELDIVDVDVLAGGNRLRRHADDLAQLAHRSAALDRLHRQFVAARDRFDGLHTAQPDLFSHRQVPGGDDQWIGRIQLQHRRLVAPVAHCVLLAWGRRPSAYHAKFT